MFHDVNYIKPAEIFMGESAGPYFGYFETFDTYVGVGSRNIAIDILR